PIRRIALCPPHARSLAARRGGADRAGESLRGPGERLVEQLLAREPAPAPLDETRQLEEVLAERLLRVLEAVDGEQRAVRRVHQRRLVANRRRRPPRWRASSPSGTGRLPRGPAQRAQRQAAAVPGVGKRPARPGRSPGLPLGSSPPFYTGARSAGKGLPRAVCGMDGEEQRPSAAPDMTRVLGMIIGLAGGTLGGLVGLGGGFIMVPLQV